MLGIMVILVVNVSDIEIDEEISYEFLIAMLNAYHIKITIRFYAYE